MVCLQQQLLYVLYNKHDLFKIAVLGNVAPLPKYRDAMLKMMLRGLLSSCTTLPIWLATTWILILCGSPNNCTTGSTPRDCSSCNGSLMCDWVGIGISKVMSTMPLIITLRMILSSNSINWKLKWSFPYWSMISFSPRVDSMVRCRGPKELPVLWPAYICFWRSRLVLTIAMFRLVHKVLHSWFTPPETASPLLVPFMWLD